MSISGESDIPSYRSNNALGFLFCAAALAAATLYIEPAIELQYCALCTIVRITLVLMAGLFLLGFIVNRLLFLQRFFALLNIALITGMLVTLVRHLFATAKSSDSCTMTATELLNTQSEFDTLLISLNNAVHCPKLQWHFHDLSFAHLASILFLILLVVVWKILVKKPQRKLLF